MSRCVLGAACVARRAGLLKGGASGDVLRTEYSFFLLCTCPLAPDADADGTDATDADGTDADATDADATDADGTDADGTDADATDADATDADATDANATFCCDHDVVDYYYYFTVYTL